MGTPLARARSAMDRDISGAMEPMSIKTRPGCAASRTPFLPQITSSEAAESVTIVMTTSEACVTAHSDPKVVSNWVMVELLGRLNKDGKDITETPIPPERLAAMLGLLAKGAISGKMAKEFFEEMYGAGADPAEILKRKGGQITDSAEVEKIIAGVLAAHPGPVAESRAGKEGTFNFLIGQVMKATKGKANPKLVNELLKKLLQVP